MIPQIGQLVFVRNRYFIVLDIVKKRKFKNTKVVLECIDNDRLGEVIELIWERENIKKIMPPDTFVDINYKFDKPHQLKALENAIKISSSSVLDDRFLSPFRGAIKIEDYQLEPLSRALRLPRVNLLIADDVGLGKTIEAGLIIEEMLARGRIHKILIVAPASLTLQWQNEMMEKFQLEFKIIDRDYLVKLRREYGIYSNPFNSYPRLIISMDYFKREQVKLMFDETIKNKNTKYWDMLIVDEAHNFAPSGKKHYIKDSDRTKLLKHISPHFEHKLFLTATPHNGYTYSFTALLELLDPLRFTRASYVNQKELKQVMIRRLKEDIKNKNFAKRNIKTITIPKNELDTKRFDLLNRYISLRLQNSDNIQTAFALTMLKKRLLSSPLAFFRSIEWHKYAIENNLDAITDEKLLNRITQLAKEDYLDDNEKEQNEEIAIIETSKLMAKLSEEEKNILNKLIDISRDLKFKADEKAKSLLKFIDEKLKTNGVYNNERLIIFTEYKDTLEYLQNLLDEEVVLTLSGSDNKEKRELIKAEFQKPPNESKKRILIATDAASEGLNLQYFCKFLIHYEIPWNPNKMEQRNGRIDRYGQKSKEVFIYHFLHEDNEDSKFLENLVSKVETMREDLGAISEIVEKNVEEAMLGKRNNLFEEIKQNIIRKDLMSEVKQELKYKNLIQKLKQTKKELNLTAENLKDIVSEAIKFYGLEGVEDISEDEGIIKKLPQTWHNAINFLKDKDGNIKKVLFDLEKEKEGYIKLHLSHPIVNYAISEYQKELFGYKNRLNRVSYKIVKNLDNLVLKASTRMIVTGKLGDLLHEEIIEIYLKLGENIELLNNFEDVGEFKELPKSVVNKIKIQIEKNKSFILKELQKKVKQKEENIKERLKQKAIKEAKILKELIDERIKEITKRLQEIKKEYKQFTLFNYEEEQQFREDEKWFERRIEDLKEKRQKEPNSIKEKYEIKDVKQFFFTLMLYIPSKAVNV